MGYKLKLSVIICTHNPHTGRLLRVLKALDEQNISSDFWELLIVDNVSDPPISKNSDFPLQLSSTRIVKGSELGLTPARLVGIEQAKGEILLFVDDDNLLSANYLTEALNLMETEPLIGAAGGIIEPEYEIPPPKWAAPYLNLLGIRNFGERPMRALVYNQVGPWEPIGAGMVIRKKIADHYRQIAQSSLRRSLDRRGTSLGSCGDTDMARCAPELGYYLAYQPQLKVTHLIPAFRLRYSYFMRLCRSLKRSGILLDRIRTGQPPPLQSSLKRSCRFSLDTMRQFTPSPRRWVLRMLTIWGELEARSVTIRND